jgi:NADH-quinone oxidoreductase subunit F
MPETPEVLLRRRGMRDSFTLRTFTETGGYEALRKALTEMTPDDVLQVVDASGLRGRGGAGFPTGRKWSFVPKDSSKPRYVVCNADEGEPGTFHDREVMEVDPHLLLEGIALASYAIGCRTAFIYLRGEMLEAYRRLDGALREAHEAGFLGERILGTGFSLDIVLHRGAGGYICGEETALLESIEGYRGMPRSRPPFPAVEGLYGCPTVVNNVLTLASVGPIVRNGAEWFRQWGTQSSPGTIVVSVSGAVQRPRNIEVPMGTTVRECIDLAGGLIPGRGLKAFAPGGSSTPMLSADYLDVGMDYESIAEAGSALGATSVIVVPEDVCIVRAVARWMDFYEHESCGKCTPCREGTYWLAHVLHRIEEGRGQARDLALLERVTENMVGKTLCALADFAGGPVTSSMRFFRDEYERHIREGACPFETRAAAAGA